MKNWRVGIFVFCFALILMIGCIQNPPNKTDSKKDEIKTCIDGFNDQVQRGILVPNENYMLGEITVVFKTNDYRVAKQMVEEWGFTYSSYGGNIDSTNVNVGVKEGTEFESVCTIRTEQKANEKVVSVNIVSIAQVST